eukprot:gene18034-36776_t
MTHRGSLGNMQLREQTHRADPGSDEVEVFIHAVDVNSRDVLNVMGMYPGDPGVEFSGVVTGVGSDVIDVRVGDTVVGAGSNCFRQYVVAKRRAVHRKPSVLRMTDGATIPIVLGTLAHLAAEETMLIHNGAGGVGLVAIQYALRVGVRIIATASAGKQEYQRSLGVQHVCTSRDSAQFREELKEILGENGSVDVVLNSLFDDYIPSSIDVMSYGGRFVGIGKRWIW